MKTVEEILGSEADPTWSDVFTLIKTKEGRKVLLFGYKILLGYEIMPDFELSHEDNSENYLREIESPKQTRLHSARRAVGKASLNAAALIPQTGVGYEQLNSRQIDTLAYESFRPPQTEPKIIELPESTPPIREAA